MPQEFVARNGIIALNSSQITGSLNVSQGITGSLLGTASYATNTAAVAGTTNYVSKFTSATALGNSQIFDNGTNVGIGVTPSAWNTVSYRVLEVNKASLMSEDVTALRLNQNYYIDASYVSRYIANGHASFYLQGSGNHIWYNAPSGTAGNAISFTQAMTLTNAGNLGLGTATPSSKLELYQSLGGGVFINLVGNGNVAGTSNVTIGQNSDDGGYFWNRKASFLSFGTSNAERVRVDASGNVGIGTTTPNAKLDVNGNAIVTGSLTVTGTITAQTLVVQTVTSSVNFITGSTRFGSTTANTHQFTGSLSVSGGLSVNATTSNFTGSVNVNGSVNLTTDQPFRLYNGAFLVGGLGSTNWAGGGVSTDTGLYSTNNLWLYAGAAVRMAISSSGNVGIGTTTPQSALSIGTNHTTLLSIGNSSWANKNVLVTGYSASDYTELLVPGSGANSAVLRMLSTGNVGIGTTTPLGLLEVYKSNNGGLGGHIILNNNGAAVGNETALMFGDGAIGSIRAAISSTTEGAPYYGDIKFKTGNTSYSSLSTRMIVLGNGNVGIGTTSPSAKLHVSGSNTNSLLLVASPGATSALFVSGSGNVGIGTNTPSATQLLDVAGTGIFRSDLSVRGLLIGYTPSYANSYLLDNTGTTSYLNATGGSVGIGTTNPQSIFHIQTPSGTSSKIWLGQTATAAWSIGNNASANTFSLIDEQFGVTRLSVGSTGNVGIGTTSPSSSLHLAKDGGAALRVTTLAGGGGANSAILLGNQDSVGTNAPAIIKSANTALLFGVGNSWSDEYGGTFTSRMAIDADGDVGIGTTSPTHKLTIASGNLAVENGQIFLLSGNNLYFDYNVSNNYSIRKDGTTLLFNTAGTFGFINGNVGIGTTSPASKLTVNGETRLLAGGKLALNRPDNGAASEVYTDASNNLILSAAGNVGIGTTGPLYKLDVNGEGRFSGLLSANNQITVGNGTTASNSSINLLGVFGVSYQWSIYNDANGFTIYNHKGVNALRINADTDAATFAGNVGIGTTSPGYKLDVLTASATDADIFRAGMLGVSNGFTVQRVSSNFRYAFLNGNVGIGTANPSYNLNVVGTTGLVKFDGNGATLSNPSLIVTDAATSGFELEFTHNAGAAWIGTYSAHNVNIMTGQSSRMFFQHSTGNVGIGTTTPNARLDVSGSATVSGSFIVTPSNAVELQVTSTGVNLGNAATDIHSVTGSLRVNGSITGSLFGTASYATQALSASWAPGGGGSAPTAVTFNRVTGSYTFALTDAGKTVEVSGSTVTTYNLTVPPASTANFADGTFIDVILYGTGSIQFVTGSGVTFRSANNWTKLGTRYGAATLINITGDEWYIIGNINP